MAGFLCGGGRKAERERRRCRGVGSRRRARPLELHDGDANGRGLSRPPGFDTDQTASLRRRMKEGERMASGLEGLSSVGAGNRRLTTPQLISNIPMLHDILEAVVEDWLRAVEPHQKEVDDADGKTAQIHAALPGYTDLIPVLLKCLFSYAFFFVATDNAYGRLYRELNQANRELSLRVKHGKPPGAKPFVEKIRLIRNISIAHFPSDRADPIDAFAAMSWGPMSLSWPNEGRPDLEKLTFGTGRFRGKDDEGQRVVSQDLEVPGLKAAHKHCLPYLERYDKTCREYLQALHAALEAQEDAIETP